MADTTAQLRIKAIVDGVEGFDRLKSSLRTLTQAVGPAESELASARKEILAFAVAGGKSEQSLRGQIEALKGLRSYASLSGSLYRQLGKDVENLTQSYREATTATKQLSEAQLRNRPLSKTPSIASQQLAVLRKDLAELDVLSADYTQKLSQITNKENALNARLGRQQVLAGARAQDPNIFPTPSLPELPNTVSGLNQLYSELQQRLANLEIGSRSYVEVSRQVADVQKRIQQSIVQTGEAYDKLGAAQEASIRRAEKIAQIQRDALKAPNVGGFRDPATGAIIARGASRQRLIDEPGFSTDATVINRARGRAYNILPSEFTTTPLLPAGPSIPITDRTSVRPSTQFGGAGYGPQVASALFDSISASRLAATTTQVQLMGKSFQEVAGQIRLTAQASDGSISSLQAQRNAWANLADSVRKGSRDYKEAQREIRRLDRQLETGEARIQKLGQTAGVVASSGIFGGIEGFVGAGLGGILGGPSGAFAGGAAGAQVSQIRQQIFGAGEFAAEINKLQTALRGVTGTATEFQAAQQAIKLAVVELNIPVQDSTRSFTRLLAAVKGAGGNVNDAEIVFRGVASAIKATGGSAEDVQGAMVALTQVFSKGKLSAEEINQIAERLPGTFTMIAKTAGMTGPELSKALEQGKVGLNEVMKFAEALSDRYAASASRMAASTDDSTARMKAALDDLRFAFGTIVKPITAAIQTVITRLADMATRTLQSVGIVKQGFAELGAVSRGKDLQRRASDAYGLLGSGSQSYKEKKAAFTAAEQLANAATEQKNIPGVRQNISALSQARDIIRRIDAEGLNENQIQRLQSYGAKLDKRIAAEERLLDILQKQNKATGFKLPKTDDAKAAREEEKAERERVRNALDLNRLKQVYLDIQLKSQKIGVGELARLDLELKALQDATRYKLNEANLDAPTEAIRQQRITNVAADYDAAKRDINDRRKQALEAVSEIGKEAKKIGSNFFSRVDRTESPIAAELQRINRLSDEAREKLDALEKRLLDNAKGRETLPEVVSARTAITAARTSSTLSPGQRDAVATANVFNADMLDLTKQISQLGSMRSELTTLDQLIIKYGEDWKLLSEAQRKSLELLANQRDRLGQLRDYASNASNSIGGAFANLITGIASSVSTGTMNVKQALATMFADIGKAFLDMANQMIAKMVAMFIFKTLLGGLFPSSSGGSAPTNPLAPGGDVWGAAGRALGNANGNAFSPTGQMAFANGAAFANNIVSRPTMFRYADGASFKMGLMGEAGPEAILPLRRGSNGRLGVDASGMSAAMGRYAMSGSSTSGAASGSGNPASGGSVNVAYTGPVLNFNGDDYLPKSAVPELINAAARRGAEMGQSKTLRTLQNSRSTRSRIGMA